MKATGIVRRIDDLGRVVIPKEIRRTLRIKEGTSLEIYTDKEGEVILKKYSPIGELSAFAQEYVDSLSLSTKAISLICDRDAFIAASSGNKKIFAEKKISVALDNIIANRKHVTSKDTNIELSTEIDIDLPFKVISPIIAQGDPIGAVLLVSKDNNVMDYDKASLLTQTGAIFLGKQMEQ